MRVLSNALSHVHAGDLYNIDNLLFTGDSAGHDPTDIWGIYHAIRKGEHAAAAIAKGKVRNDENRWKDRFEKRFLLMDNLRNYFLKDHASAEPLAALHGRHGIEVASLMLWLRKGSGKEGLIEYMRFFRKILC